MFKKIFDKINKQVDPPVFWISNLLVLVIMVMAVGFENGLNVYVGTVKNYILNHLSSVYVYPFVFFTLVFLFLLIFPKNIRIGGAKAKKEFGFITWSSMLFSAGMGIGLIYAAPFEPVSHYLNSPDLMGLPEQQRKLGALSINFFHWGFPAWFLYSLTGLVFAYNGFNLKRGFIFSGALPKRFKILSIVLNVFCILSVMVGIITSFVLGVKQINSGFSQIFPSISINVINQALIIGLITLMATLSVLTGLYKGIKRLSQINIAFIFILLIYILFQSSISSLLNTFVSAFWVHIKELPMLMLDNPNEGPEKEWFVDWTILYWAWWVSWAPFVGLFIARISKGRTLREYLLATVFIPALFSIIWFSLFGEFSFSLKNSMGQTYINAIIDQPSNSMFILLKQTVLPLFSMLLALVSVMIFYITSSDSGSLVIDMIASGGKEKPNSYLKVYWSCIEGLLAIILLCIGGIDLIKNLVVLFSFPLFIYITFAVTKLCIQIYKDN